MVKNKVKTLLELITDYSKLQDSDSEEDLNKASEISSEIREELWITGDLETSLEEQKKEIEQAIRSHKHVDGKVVKDY